MNLTCLFNIYLTWNVPQKLETSEDKQKQNQTHRESYTVRLLHFINGET